MTELAVSANSLGRTFGKKVALQDLTVDIPRGSVCGLVGPNGAGKTTALRLLLGLIPPTSGKARVLGLDPQGDGLKLRARVGYVPEKHNIYSWMKVRQVLAFTSKVYPTWDADECGRLSELLALPEQLKVRDLSRGELAKLALTIALAHRPELLILDEPTSGLDPIIRREFLTAIGELVREEGRTVVFSTHILSDVEQVADRVLMLAHGQLHADDQLEALKQRFSRVSFLFPEPPEEDLELPEAHRLQRGTREWVAVLERQGEPEVASLADRIGASDFSIHAMTLEDVFVTLADSQERSTE